MDSPISTEDLSRLRIPLVGLPGFDPVGLRVWCGGQYTRSPGQKVYSICLAKGAHDGRVGDYSVSGCGWYPVGSLFLDLSEAHTADRVVRWVAGRVGLEIGCTAPQWFVPDPRFSDGPWILRGGELDSYVFACFGHPDLFGDLSRMVPTLGGLDSTDDRRLLDGARFIDRLALGLTAVCVGT